MSESNKCCKKCDIQTDDQITPTPCEHCPCHSTTPSLEGFKTLIYNLGVAGDLTTTGAIDIKEYVEALLDHQQAEQLAFLSQRKHHGFIKWKYVQQALTTYQEKIKSLNS